MRDGARSKRLPYLLPILLGATCLAPASHAQIAVSANDGHTSFDNGRMVGTQSDVGDHAAIINLAASPPRIIATIPLPTSVVAPPTSVAVSSDARFAIISSSMKFDATVPSRLSPNDQLTVIDLTANPPAIVQSLTAGSGAGAMRLSRDNRLLLVSNRFDDTLSIFTVADGRLTPAGKVMLEPGCQPAGMDFTRDGKAALVACRLGNKIVVLHIDGSDVTVDARPITTSIGPYSVMVNPQGNLAAVTNVGRGDGDIDTISLIDLTEQPFYTVETISVGRGPEALRWSPDGQFLALDTQEGTTKPPGDPFRREQGRLHLYKVTGHQLRLVAEAPLGHWSHGIAFSRDGRRIFVQNMVEKNIQFFDWNGKMLKPATSIALKAGPAGLDVAGR